MNSRFIAISREPFARLDVVRRLVDTASGCSWCGGRRRSGRLFQYGVDPDSLMSRTAWTRGLFCSKACHDSYNS